jgi:hypothetical protein
MIKRPFTPRDLLNESNMRVMSTVAELFKKHDAKTGCDTTVILEDCGSWLQQNAWTDDTGLYLTLRLAPFVTHREDERARGRAIWQDFIAAVGGATHNAWVEESEDDYIHGGKTTIYVKQSTYSIGD